MNMPRRSGIDGAVFGGRCQREMCWSPWTSRRRRRIFQAAEVAFREFDAFIDGQLQPAAHVRDAACHVLAGIPRGAYPSPSTEAFLDGHVYMPWPRSARYRVGSGSEYVARHSYLCSPCGLQFGRASRVLGGPWGRGFWLCGVARTGRHNVLSDVSQLSRVSSVLQTA